MESFEQIQARERARIAAELAAEQAARIAAERLWQAGAPERAAQVARINRISEVGKFVAKRLRPVVKPPHLIETSSIRENFLIRRSKVAAWAVAGFSESMGSHSMYWSYDATLLDSRGYLYLASSSIPGSEPVRVPRVVNYYHVSGTNNPARRDKAINSQYYPKVEDALATLANDHDIDLSQF